MWSPSVINRCLQAEAYPILYFFDVTLLHSSSQRFGIYAIVIHYDQTCIIYYFVWSIIPILKCSRFVQFKSTELTWLPCV